MQTYLKKKTTLDHVSPNKWIMHELLKIHLSKNIYNLDSKNKCVHPKINFYNILVFRNTMIIKKHVKNIYNNKNIFYHILYFNYKTINEKTHK